jgi:hypothetical protein
MLHSGFMEASLSDSIAFMNEPVSTPEIDDSGPLVRTVDVDEISIFLAGLLNVPARRRATPRKIEVDASALVAWVLEGIEALQVPAPDVEPTRRGPWMPAARVLANASRRVALALAMERHVSITAAAEAMQTSRRALRDSLKHHGLYTQFRDRYRPRHKAKPLPETEVSSAT